MPLEQDTLYYRADHPLGFLFSAGNEAPSAEDGWVAAQEDIAPLPPRAFECTTLEAYEALLRGERASSLQFVTELQLATQRLAVATGLIAALQNDNNRLTEENAALRAEQEE